MRGEWPERGRAPVTKARVMAMAYHAKVEQLEDAINQLRAYRDNLGAVGRNPARDAIDGFLDTVSQTPTLAQMDAKFASWGETFHVPEPDLDAYEDDDYVDTKVAAKMAMLSNKRINELCTIGRLPGKWDTRIGVRGGWTFLVADIRKLATDVRTRNWHGKRAGDSIPDSRSGDSE